MVVTAYAGRLLGRQRERAVLERLLDTARGGHGAVLVVHGDPGVGKTALLDCAVEAGEGFRVVRTAGVEGEMELDYAALQQLCSPILEFLERLVAETGGNPLALLELPRGLTPAQLAGGFGLPAALPLSTGIEQSYTRRLARLPRDTRRLLLLAAAEPVGDLALLWRAAQQLGIPETAAHAAESEDLLMLDGAVVFRHPLVRSAVYGAAEPSERRDAHRALADATDLQIDPDRRAWHRAQAASVPDEDIAAELERSAGRAQARGGLAAVAAFLERAAALTPQPTHRAQRLLAAAGAKRDAGALEAALELLEDVE